MKTPGLRVLAPGRPRSVKPSSDTTAGASVDARLSSTDDDVMQWADVYDRDVKDIFAVEDKIANAIAESVRPMAGQRRQTARI